MGTRSQREDSVEDLLGKEESQKAYLRSFGMRGEPHAGGLMKGIAGEQQQIVQGGCTSAQLLWGIKCVVRITQGRSISEEEKGGKDVF